MRGRPQRAVADSVLLAGCFDGLPQLYRAGIDSAQWLRRQPHRLDLNAGLAE